MSRNTGENSDLAIVLDSNDDDDDDILSGHNVDLSSASDEEVVFIPSRRLKTEANNDDTVSSSSLSSTVDQGTQLTISGVDVSPGLLPISTCINSSVVSHSISHTTKSSACPQPQWYDNLVYTTMSDSHKNNSQRTPVYMPEWQKFSPNLFPPPASKPTTSNSSRSTALSNISGSMGKTSPGYDGPPMPSYVPPYSGTSQSNLNSISKLSSSSYGGKPTFYVPPCNGKSPNANKPPTSSEKVQKPSTSGSEKYQPLKKRLLRRNAHMGKNIRVIPGLESAESSSSSDDTTDDSEDDGKGGGKGFKKGKYFGKQSSGTDNAGCKDRQVVGGSNDSQKTVLRKSETNVMIHKGKPEKPYRRQQSAPPAFSKTSKSEDDERSKGKRKSRADKAERSVSDSEKQRSSTRGSRSRKIGPRNCKRLSLIIPGFTDSEDESSDSEPESELDSSIDTLPPTDPDCVVCMEILASISPETVVKSSATSNGTTNDSVTDTSTNGQNGNDTIISKSQNCDETFDLTKSAMELEALLDDTQTPHNSSFDTAQDLVDFFDTSSIDADERTDRNASIDSSSSKTGKPKNCDRQESQRESPGKSKSSAKDQPYLCRKHQSAYYNGKKVYSIGKFARLLLSKPKSKTDKNPAEPVTGIENTETSDTHGANNPSCSTSGLNSTETSYSSKNCDNVKEKSFYTTDKTVTNEHSFDSDPITIDQSHSSSDNNLVSSRTTANSSSCRIRCSSSAESRAEIPGILHAHDCDNLENIVKSEADNNIANSAEMQNNHSIVSHQICIASSSTISLSQSVSSTINIVNSTDANKCTSNNIDVSDTVTNSCRNVNIEHSNSTSIAEKIGDHAAVESQNLSFETNVSTVTFDQESTATQSCNTVGSSSSNNTQTTVTVNCSSQPSSSTNSTTDAASSSCDSLTCSQSAPAVKSLRKRQMSESDSDLPTQPKFLRCSEVEQQACSTVSTDAVETSMESDKGQLNLSMPTTSGVNIDKDRKDEVVSSTSGVCAMALLPCSSAPGFRFTIHNDPSSDLINDPVDYQMISAVTRNGMEIPTGYCADQVKQESKSKTSGNQEAGDMITNTNTTMDTNSDNDNTNTYCVANEMCSNSVVVPLSREVDSVNCSIESTVLNLQSGNTVLNAPPTSLGLDMVTSSTLIESNSEVMNESIIGSITMVLSNENGSNTNSNNNLDSAPGNSNSASSDSNNDQYPVITIKPECSDIDNQRHVFDRLSFCGNNDHDAADSTFGAELISSESSNLGLTNKDNACSASNITAKSCSDNASLRCSDGTSHNGSDIGLSSTNGEEVSHPNVDSVLNCSSESVINTDTSISVAACNTMAPPSLECNSTVSCVTVKISTGDDCKLTDCENSNAERDSPNDSTYMSANDVCVDMGVNGSLAATNVTTDASVVIPLASMDGLTSKKLISQDSFERAYSIDSTNSISKFAVIPKDLIVDSDNIKTQQFGRSDYVENVNSNISISNSSLISSSVQDSTEDLCAKLEKKLTSKVSSTEKLNESQISDANDKCETSEDKCSNDHGETVKSVCNLEVSQSCLNSSKNDSNELMKDDNIINSSQKNLNALDNVDECEATSTNSFNEARKYDNLMNEGDLLKSWSSKTDSTENNIDSENENESGGSDEKSDSCVVHNANRPAHDSGTSSDEDDSKSVQEEDAESNDHNDKLLMPAKGISNLSSDSEEDAVTALSKSAVTSKKEESSRSSCSKKSPVNKSTEKATQKEPIMISLTDTEDDDDIIVVKSLPAVKHRVKTKLTRQKRDLVIEIEDSDTDDDVDQVSSDDDNDYPQKDNDEVLNLSTKDHGTASTTLDYGSVNDVLKMQADTTNKEASVISSSKEKRASFFYQSKLFNSQYAAIMKQNQVTEYRAKGSSSPRSGCSPETTKVAGVSMEDVDSKDKSKEESDKTLPLTKRSTLNADAAEFIPKKHSSDDSLSSSNPSSESGDIFSVPAFSPFVQRYTQAVNPPTPSFNDTTSPPKPEASTADKDLLNSIVDRFLSGSSDHTQTPFNLNHLLDDSDEGIVSEPDTDDASSSQATAMGSTDNANAKAGTEGGIASLDAISTSGDLLATDLDIDFELLKTVAQSMSDDFERSQASTSKGRSTPVIQQLDAALCIANSVTNEAPDPPDLSPDTETTDTTSNTTPFAGWENLVKAAKGSKGCKGKSLICGKRSRFIKSAKAVKLSEKDDNHKIREADTKTQVQCSKVEQQVENDETDCQMHLESKIDEKEKVLEQNEMGNKQKIPRTNKIADNENIVSAVIAKDGSSLEQNDIWKGELVYAASDLQLPCSFVAEKLPKLIKDGLPVSEWPNSLELQLYSMHVLRCLQKKPNSFMPGGVKLQLGGNSETRLLRALLGGYQRMGVVRLCRLYMIIYFGKEHLYGIFPRECETFTNFLLGQTRLPPPKIDVQETLKDGTKAPDTTSERTSDQSSQATTPSQIDSSEETSVKCTTESPDAVKLTPESKAQSKDSQDTAATNALSSVNEQSADAQDANTRALERKKFKEMEIEMFGDNSSSDESDMDDDAVNKGETVSKKRRLEPEGEVLLSGEGSKRRKEEPHGKKRHLDSDDDSDSNDGQMHKSEPKSTASCTAASGSGDISDEDIGSMAPHRKKCHLAVDVYKSDSKDQIDNTDNDSDGQDTDSSDTDVGTLTIESAKRMEKKMRALLGLCGGEEKKKKPLTFKQVMKAQDYSDNEVSSMELKVEEIKSKKMEQGKDKMEQKNDKSDVAIQKADSSSLVANAGVTLKLVLPKKKNTKKTKKSKDPKNHCDKSMNLKKIDILGFNEKETSLKKHKHKKFDRKVKKRPYEPPLCGIAAPSSPRSDGPIKTLNSTIMMRKVWGVFENFYLAKISNKVVNTSVVYNHMTRRFMRTRDPEHFNRKLKPYNGNKLLPQGALKLFRDAVSSNQITPPGGANWSQDLAPPASLSTPVNSGASSRDSSVAITNSGSLTTNSRSETTNIDSVITTLVTPNTGYIKANPTTNSAISTAASNGSTNVSNPEPVTAASTHASRSVNLLAHSGNLRIKISRGSENSSSVEFVSTSTSDSGSATVPANSSSVAVPSNSGSPLKMLLSRSKDNTMTCQLKDSSKVELSDLIKKKKQPPNVHEYCRHKFSDYLNVLSPAIEKEFIQFCNGLKDPVTICACISAANAYIGCLMQRTKIPKEKREAKKTSIRAVMLKIRLFKEVLDFYRILKESPTNKLLANIQKAAEGNELLWNTLIGFCSIFRVKIREALRLENLTAESTNYLGKPFDFAWLIKIMDDPESAIKQRPVPSHLAPTVRHRAMLPTVCTANSTSTSQQQTFSNHASPSKQNTSSGIDAENSKNKIKVFGQLSEGSKAKLSLAMTKLSKPKWSELIQYSQEVLSKDLCLKKLTKDLLLADTNNLGSMLNRLDALSVVELDQLEIMLKEKEASPNLLAMTGSHQGKNSIISRIFIVIEYNRDLIKKFDTEALCSDMIIEFDRIMANLHAFTLTWARDHRLPPKSNQRQDFECYCKEAVFYFRKCALKIRLQYTTCMIKDMMKYKAVKAILFRTVYLLMEQFEDIEKLLTRDLTTEHRMSLSVYVDCILQTFAWLCNPMMDPVYSYVLSSPFKCSYADGVRHKLDVFCGRCIQNVLWKELLYEDLKKQVNELVSVRSPQYQPVTTTSTTTHAKDQQPQRSTNNPSTTSRSGKSIVFPDTNAAVSRTYHKDGKQFTISSAKDLLRPASSNKSAEVARNKYVTSQVNKAFKLIEDYRSMVQRSLVGSSLRVQTIIPSCQIQLANASGSTATSSSMQQSVLSQASASNLMITTQASGLSQSATLTSAVQPSARNQAPTLSLTSMPVSSHASVPIQGSWTSQNVSLSSTTQPSGSNQTPGSSLTSMPGSSLPLIPIQTLGPSQNATTVPKPKLDNEKRLTPTKTSTKVGDPGFEPPYKRNMCDKCEAVVKPTDLSLCMDKHKVCGTCLMSVIKEVLISTKTSVTCTVAGCNAFYMISELKKTISADFVDILESRHLKEQIRNTDMDILPGSGKADDNNDDDDDAEKTAKAIAIAKIKEDLQQSAEKQASTMGPEFPSTWKPMDQNKDYELFVVDGDSAEYAVIASLFHDTLYHPQFQIQSIRRIQNPHLWQVYNLEKKRMTRKLGDANEKQLFHGTTVDRIDPIARHNFDWRKSGRNATMYGKGCYFARQAAYSHKYTEMGKYTQIPGHHNRPIPSTIPLSGVSSHFFTNLTMMAPVSAHSGQSVQSNVQQPAPASAGHYINSIPAHQGPPQSVLSYMINHPYQGLNVPQPPQYVNQPSGSQQQGNLQIPAPLSSTQPLNTKRPHSIFVARCLTGKYAKGQPGYTLPPPLDPNQPHGEHYDSCVDVSFNPHMFILFHTQQIYPEYVIDYISHDFPLNQKQ